mgnify:CR=1 FL=1
MSQLHEYTTPNTAKCLENSAQIKRETEAFLKNGGQIKVLESQLITEAAKSEASKNEAARKRGMKNFNGGTPK